jgi:hypothetical protein
MSTNRRGYLIALVIVIVTLIGTVGAAAVYATSHGSSWAAASQGDTGWGGMMDGPGWGGGMMGGSDSGTAAVSLQQAQSIAQDWVSRNAAGATLDSGVTMPMGYLFTATRDNQIVARIMVNDDTGQVITRSGTYPTPAATASSGG